MGKTMLDASGIWLAAPKNSIGPCKAAQKQKRECLKMETSSSSSFFGRPWPQKLLSRKLLKDKSQFVLQSTSGLTDTEMNEAEESLLESLAFKFNNCVIS